ncbi:hypothetical protein FHR84_002131 [Actinopolyspora biskrensis]|uniref:Uncharacterized protein n=1 Tax=Actinopolyspora biskrensis TaxID=1470178 RepID=A0A852Z5F1_9ACTN|nr:hypothetical protein [Actinopolyspora biskrensis]NYH78806.1 hypothetical protein [Actinopolyspora biskrensis]
MRHIASPLTTIAAVCVLALAATPAHAARGALTFLSRSGQKIAAIAHEPANGCHQLPDHWKKLGRVINGTNARILFSADSCGVKDPWTQRVVHPSGQGYVLPGTLSYHVLPES